MSSSRKSCLKARYWDGASHGFESGAGIVYSAFDEKLGPEPFVWIPATLPRDMLDMVSWESINTRIRANNIMKQLCHIPLLKFNAMTGENVDYFAERLNCKR
nr:hypothetical protein [Candidatus Sigynarchaeum springense]